MDAISKDHKKKIRAAYELLTEDTTTFAKFENIRTLLAGINPTIDKTLASCSVAIQQLKKVQGGEMIELAAENLPEGTEKDRKRKKAILLLLSSFKNLRSEVKRVMELYGSESSHPETMQEHAGTFAKIFAFAKGPLGFVTVVAALIAGGLILLNSLAVTIVIKNRGCQALVPFVRLPFPIPGLELPSANIPDGGQGIARIPPLTVSVDGTNSEEVVLSAFNFKMSYELSRGVADVVFNNQSLLGRRTTINLRDSKEHEVIIRCAP